MPSPHDAVRSLAFRMVHALPGAGDDADHDRAALSALTPSDRELAFQIAARRLAFQLLYELEVGGIKDDRLRLTLLAAVMVAVWLRFAGYLQLQLFARTFEVRVGTNRPVGYLRSAFVGGAFGLGWTPCVGPILGSILTLAADSGDALRGTFLLVWYALGLSIPFLIAGLAISDVNRFLKRIQPYTPVIEVLSGVMLIGVGVLLISGRLTGLNDYFSFADFNQGL